MDIERFEALAEAYGGDLRRWPEAERTAALALRSRAPQAAQAALAAAAALDAALDAWRSEPVTSGLRERVLAAAPRPRPARRGLGLWLSGAGIAAVAVAGVIVGVVATGAAVSNLQADALLAEALPDDAAPPAALFTVGTVEAPKA